LVLLRLLWLTPDWVVKLLSMAEAIQRFRRRTASR
jgi:hypothetical protein